MDTYLRNLLGENEQILLVTRQHWTVLAAEIISETVLTLAVIVLISLLTFLPPPIGNPLWAVGYVLLAFPLVSLLRDVTIWSNRKFVITNLRVIQVQGVLSKDVTDSSLEKVNDVKLEQSFLGRLLGYGDVEILTASELGVNRFRRIADPVGFKTAMLNAKNRLEHPDARRGAPAVPASASLAQRGAASRAAPSGRVDNGTATPAPADIPTLIRQLDELRQAGLLTEAEFQNKKAQLLSRL